MTISEEERSQANAAAELLSRRLVGHHYTGESRILNGEECRFCNWCGRLVSLGNNRIVWYSCRRNLDSVRGIVVPCWEIVVG